MLIGLIVTALIVGLVIGYTIHSPPTQTKTNQKSFVIDVESNKILATSSDCIEEYKRQYGYSFGECEMDYVHVGSRFIDRIDCSCWRN